MKIISYLKQPFPRSGNKWKTIILISIFVVFFLALFQPFGINTSGNTSYSGYLFITGYGLVTLTVLFIDLILIEKVFPVFFSEKNWTIGRELIWLFIVITTIGIGNVLYSVLFIKHFEMTLNAVVNFQIITFAIAVFPISILVITKQNYLSRKHSVSAKIVNEALEKENRLNENAQIIIFRSSNKKDSVEFKICDFYFIESTGNYVNIYLSEGNKVTRLTLRNTLKDSLQYFTGSPKVIQCHRAYIVNTNKIVNAKGNSQGLKLKLSDCNIEIPVSRNFVNSVRDLYQTAM